MNVLSTPDERFAGLQNFSFKPHYAEIDGMRMHYLDEGDREGEVVLLLHGNPTWCYLYREMIPIFVDAGYRVLAPDMLGFGRSDKPLDQSEHTYSNHVRWLGEWFKQMDSEVNLFCQDWGGLIGLRLVAMWPERFRRVVAGNTSLPDTSSNHGNAAEQKALYASIPTPTLENLFDYMSGDHAANGFWYWRKFAAESPEFNVGLVLATEPDATPESMTGYNAPYPEEKFLTAPRAFPSMGPIFSDDPELQRNDSAWAKLAEFKKPFMTLWTHDEFVSSPYDEKRFQTDIPGAANVQHKKIPGSHFIGSPEAAYEIVRFIQDDEA